MPLFLTLLLYFAISPIHVVSSASADDNLKDSAGEDFEEENSIQLCCTWGSDLQDGKLKYNIDDIDGSKDQQNAVRNAIEEWDSSIGSLDLERVSSTTQSDIRVEFYDGSEETAGDEEIAGKTVTIFDQYGFLDNAEITIYKEPYGYELETSEVEQIVKHEMGHALGLGHANFDGNLMALRVNDGTDTISECEIKAVIEANYWKLGGYNRDNTYPSYPKGQSVICEDDS
jgi:predicted Zn-dependent protease